VTPREVRGRRITFAIAGILALPVPVQVLVLTFSGQPAPAGAWTSQMFAAAIVLVTCGLLYKAYEWARFCIGWLWLVTGVIRAGILVSIAKDLSTAHFGAWVWFFVLQLISIAVASVLLWSPSVTAHFDRQNLGPILRVPDQEASV
jgi:hypothetical protein